MNNTWLELVKRIIWIVDSMSEDMSHSKSLDFKQDAEVTTLQTSSGRRQRTLTEKGKDFLLAQLKVKRQTLAAQLTMKMKCDKNVV